MSTLIPLIGRKSLKARLAYLVMYTLLILGGITMVVPFLALLSNSFKSSVDSLTFEIPPRFFYDNKWLAMKYVEQEINYDMELYKGLARSSTATMRDVVLPGQASDTQQQDYYEFLKSLPPTYTYLTCRGKADANPGNIGTHPAVLDYRKFILGKYGSLAAVERKHGVPLPDRENLTPPFEKWHLRTYQPEYDLRMQDFMAFKATQPVQRLIPAAIEAKWNVGLRSKYAADVETANKDLGTKYSSIEGATMALRLPQGASKAVTDMWIDVVRNTMPIWFVRADESAHPAWAKFLQKRSHDIENYNLAHDSAYARFEDIPLPAKESAEYTLLKQGYTVSEWSDFLTGKESGLPMTAVYLDTPEQRYRDFLKAKYGTLAAVDAAYGTQYAANGGKWSSVFLPTIEVKVSEVAQNAGPIRWEFIARNYRTVTNYLLLHGRAFLNTAAYILLALFFTLTVNPITAYSLSRFKLRSTNKILLFLLATMAFPAEIAMIPNFLILKELHLLNTYWALVLPGMANGFNIFLLKGMFDGLPQDLYEAAMLDGAGEATIFWKVTMPLVKPFLAYLSLGTFVAAYSAYIFAMLLCPDPKMWTIMVFLQQMDWAGQPVKFAAYVLASIPTLIVFVTCQRIIMRGIVLPTEK